MKNSILGIEEKLIEAARERAALERTTLDEKFRRSLQEYVGQDRRVDKAMQVIERLRRHVHTGGRKFSRDEMNQR